MKDYCVYCMQPSDEDICPHCGKSSADYHAEIHQLNPGTVLNGKYLIGAVLGEGGFGITYVGRDITLDMKIAVKEYFPNGAVNRNNTHSTEITRSTGQMGENFEKGKISFLTEARTLAKFASEQNCVAVRDFFEENNTAYIVMEYLEGTDLKEYLSKHEKLSFNEVCSLLIPVMKTLSKVHAQGLIHRDISPANIMVLPSGTAKLLDFGAAREVSGDDEKSLSILLKPGYAPEEQYRTKGKQGPWTDVYALSATVYKLLTGVTPEDSMNRVFEDYVEPISKYNPSVTPEQEAVVMKGMSVKMDDRYQNMEEMIAAYYSCISSPAAATASAIPKKQKNQRKKGKKGIKILLITAGTILLLFIILIIIFVIQTNDSSDDSRSARSDSVSITDDAVVRLSEKSVSVEDIENLKNNEKLTSLYIDNCSLTDAHLDAVAKLENVKSLDISGNPDITDISVLNNMPELASLYVNDMPQLDLTKLTNQAVTGLFCANCELTDISFLDALAENLNKLDVSGNKITDISVLGKMTHLENMYINLADNLITDISVLKDTEGPQSLDISKNQITDISAMTGHSKIIKLNVSRNQLTDISSLTDCFNIENLDISYNMISDIEAVSGIDALEHITLHHNRITSLLPLKECKNLAGVFDVDARYNQLTSADGIEAFFVNSKPTKVYLSHNQLTDISALESLSDALSSVYLNDNALTNDNLKSLIGFKKLSSIEIADNPISSVDILTDEKQKGYKLDKSNMKLRISYNENIDFTALKEELGMLTVYDPDSERSEDKLRESYILVGKSEELYESEYEDAALNTAYISGDSTESAETSDSENS